MVCAGLTTHEPSRVLFASGSMHIESESFELDLHHITIQDVVDRLSPLQADSHFVSAVQPAPSSPRHDQAICDEDARSAVQDYTYRQPPLNQIALLDATPQANHIISPNRQLFILLGVSQFRSLEGLSSQEIGLAGFRLDPRTHCLSRTTTYNSLSIMSISDVTASPLVNRPVQLPNDGRILAPIFSHDSRYLAFLLYSPSLNNDVATKTIPSPILLYFIDTHDPDLAVQRLSQRPVSQIFGKPFSWTVSHTVIFRTPIPSRGPVPSRPKVSVGPVVLESGLGHDVKRRSGGERTIQDLLKDGFDCHLFEFFCTVQIVQCSPTGQDVLLPLTGMIKACLPSPDHQYLLIKSIHPPYSYFIPYARFPTRIEIYKLTDNGLIFIRQLVDLKLADSVPISFDACRVGPRRVTWRDDAPATLIWVEAQDSGDPKCNPAIGVRDTIWILPAPFIAEPVCVLSLMLRFKSILFGDGHALVTERWFRTRQRKTWMLLLDRRDHDKNKTLIWSGSFDDRYNDPGHPQVHNGVLDIAFHPESGYPVLTLLGDGAGPEGDRPFVRSFNLYDSTERILWRSSVSLYERPIIRLNDDHLIILRESPRQPPQFFLISMSRSFPDLQISIQPHPCLKLLDVQCQLVHYNRADGVKLSGFLYLPPGFESDQDEPLPTILWAYPREYKSVDTASQVVGSPNMFVLDGRPSLYFLLEGYAVLDRMTMPIVAEGPNAEPNDTYIEQLVANAAAAIDHLVAIGVTDRERVGVGGHSYGAFMTANLLAHSNLFAAGVARSGAYNRTLTPFGFQKEERTLWEAPGVYQKMSPYMAADRIRSPLLLIHGQADNNAGTYPMQSERMFAALKSHAKAPARLVLLPHESHHYKSRESNAHVLWETTRWFSTYVKYKNNPKHIRSRSIYL